MKFTFPVALTLLMGTAAEAFKPKTNAEKFKLHQDFMKAIHADGRIASAQRLKRENERKRHLMDKLMAAATPKAEHDKRRGLEQSNGEYTFGDYEWMNPVYQQMVEDGVFDLTARSFKYSGCAAIKSFDTDKAEANGNPMTVDTYAVFRLCPEDSCNKYSLTGCGKNYGEYVVEMSTYLGFMLEFYENHYGAYCEYCYPCDYAYQVQKKSTQAQCYDGMVKGQYNGQQNQQQQAWENYYQQHFGDMSQYQNDKAQYEQQMQNQMNNYQGNSNNYQANNVNYNVNGNGNRKLDGGYYSDFTEYQSQNSNGQDNSGYAGGYGGQADGQAYYNMMNAQYQQQDGEVMYGYYNENGEYVDLCEANGYVDEYGRVYNINCNNYNGGGGGMKQCSDGSTCDACEYKVDQNYMPCDEYVCKDYYTYCSDLYEPGYKQMYNNEEAQEYDQNNNQNQKYNYNYKQQQEENDLYNFLDCTEYVNEYGQQYYVGPHCGSDHYTISLGVFSDENCVDYVGETVSLSKVLGYGYDEDSFFHLPHECISCDGSAQFQDDEELYEQMYKGQGVYGEYVEAPNSDFDDVVAVCAALFERSAQCNIHMSNYGMMSKYMDDIDAEYEKRYCNFIDNIVYGTYNENGEIKLKADSFDFSDWRNPEQYKKMKMPVGQAVGLALSVLLVVSLSALAFVTQRALTRGRSSPWRPKRVFKKGVERGDSGIVMGRSGSGPAPLI